MAVFHQIRQTQRRRATDACVTVKQHASVFITDMLYLISNGVKIVTESRFRIIRDRHVHVIHSGNVCVAYVLSRVNNTCNVERTNDRRVACCFAVADVQTVRYLSKPTESTSSSWHGMNTGENMQVSVLQTSQLKSIIWQT